MTAILNSIVSNTHDGEVNTQSYNVSAGRNRKVLVFVSGYNVDGGLLIDTITCDGDAPTLIATTSIAAGTPQWHSWIYELFETDISTDTGLSCVVDFNAIVTVSSVSIIVIVLPYA